MLRLRRWAFGSADGESGADESMGAALAASARVAPDPVVAEARATDQLVPAVGVVAEQGDDQPVAARTRNSPLKPLVSERAPGLMGGDEEENTVAPVVRLSPEELVCKRSATFSLPCGAPEGPWAKDTDALYEINRWASDHTKPGGSWGVIFLKAKQPGNSARGAQRVLGCAEHKKSSCGAAAAELLRRRCRSCCRCRRRRRRQRRLRRCPRQQLWRRLRSQTRMMLCWPGAPRRRRRQRCRQARRRPHPPGVQSARTVPSRQRCAPAARRRRRWLFQPMCRRGGGQGKTASKRTGSELVYMTHSPRAT
jgi:hypothetical protein